jgi:copper(I)-binding protein
MTRKADLALLTALGLAAAPPAHAGPSVRVADAWCRAAPVGATTAACYLTLTASADDRLLSVSTPAADHGEVHTMSMTGGVMRMRQLADGLALPAGRPVALRPGAEHLMIIGPRRTVAAGDSLALTLRFAKAPAVKVKAPVRAVTAGMGAH